MSEVGVGLIGLGTVGAVVARRLVGEWELLSHRAGAIPVLRRAAVRDPSRPRDLALPTVQLDSDPESLVDDATVEIVVELMGGVDRASALMERALRARKPVVTANKAALAAHGLELAALAVERGVSLRYEAAVGAGLPVVGVLRDSLRGDRIAGLEMIINSTTNLILTRMERDHIALHTAVLEAQARGLAETDPAADVDGHDAAAKLVLLGRLAFDAPLTTADVHRVGIGGLTVEDIAGAARLGGSLKLVAGAVRDGDVVTLWVRPTVVGAKHPLHGVDGADNAVLISSDLAGQLRLRGLGGGGDSTASAVLSDIVATVSSPSTPPPLPSAAAAIGDVADAERGGYLRVRLRPRAEAAELVLQALEDRGIPVLGSALLSGADGGTELVLLTGAVQRAMLERATETLDSLPAVAEVAAVMDWAGPA
ncbi:MAG: homoserine dehydrogenase [Candidatus Dormibacteria bacterium]